MDEGSGGLFGKLPEEILLYLLEQFLFLSDVKNLRCVSKLLNARICCSMPSVFGTLKIDTIGPIEYRILENCMQRPLGLPKTLDLNMLNKNSNRKLLKDVMCKYMNRITGLELALSVFGNGILTDGEECCLLYMRFNMLHSLTIRLTEVEERVKSLEIFKTLLSKHSNHLVNLQVLDDRRTKTRFFDLPKLPALESLVLRNTGLNTSVSLMRASSQNLTSLDITDVKGFKDCYLTDSYVPDMIALQNLSLRGLELISTQALIRKTRKTLTSLKVLNVLSDDDFSASKLIIDIPNLKNLTEDVASTEIWGNKVPNHSNLESMMLIGDTFAYRNLPESFPKLKTVFACSLPEYKLVDFLSSCDESIECLAVSSSKKRYFDDGPKFTRMENLKELYLGNDSLSEEALDDLLTKNCNNLQFILFQFYGVKEINMLKDISVKLLKVKTVIVSTLSVQEDKIRELIGGICPNARVVIGDRRNESHIVREIMAARFKHLKYDQEFQSMFMTYFG